MNNRILPDPHEPRTGREMIYFGYVNGTSNGSTILYKKGDKKCLGKK